MLTACLLLLFLSSCAAPSQPTTTPLPATELPSPTAALTPALTATAIPTIAPSPAAATPTAVVPTVTPVPTVGAQATLPPGSVTADEAILILEPGPGSQVAGPIHVAGLANPTFEQTLVVRLVSPEGRELAVQSTHITADVGQRGPFAADIAVPVGVQGQVFVQVYSTSARDGGITHLAAVVVGVVAPGNTRIVLAQPHAEAIDIRQPSNGATIVGGTVHVTGVGVASFEQTLVIELQDDEGKTIVSQPIIVAAPDLGQPGALAADLAYPATATGPARVVVHDPSAAFEGDVHLSSVEITLQP